MRINQATGFRKVTSEYFSEDTIPIHPNVIKNIANVELFYTHDEDYEDCLGLITLMEKGGENLHRLLRYEIPTIAQRRSLAIELRTGVGNLPANLGGRADRAGFFGRQVFKNSRLIFF